MAGFLDSQSAPIFSTPSTPALQCWKFGVFLAGTVHGVQAGVSGFRCGMRWAAAHSRANMQLARTGVRWAPEMALAAGTVPPLKVGRCGCESAWEGVPLPIQHQRHLRRVTL
jgi:hypothetical protein